MDTKIKDPNVDYLVSALLKLKTRDECHRFLEDLFTVQEVKAISQRLVVAQMLCDQWVYNDIVEKTGASTATISRVNRSFNYGHGGYQLVFDRMTAEDRAVLPKRDQE